MAADLFYLPFRPALDANGGIVTGAKLYFYATGTTTPQATYTTSALSVEHPHPVVANSAGVWSSIYLNDALTYRLVIKDSGGTTLYDLDPYIAGVAGETGPTGPTGPAGTASSNSGIVTTATNGDGALAPTIGVQVTSGTGATDTGGKITMQNGARSGLDIYKGTTGGFMRFYESGSTSESLAIGDGAAILSRKWMIISGTVTVSNPGPTAQTLSTFHPASARQNMFSIFSDTRLCMELRAPTLDVGSGDRYYLISGMDADGKEHFALLQNGEMRFSAAGIQTGNHTNGGSTAQTVDSLTLGLKPVSAKRLRLYSLDVPTHGQAEFEIEKNGAIVGESADATVRNLVKYESGQTLELGNTYAGAKIFCNPSSPLELPVTDMKDILRLFNANKATIGGYAVTAGRMVFCTDEVGGPTIVYADGTNWRRVYDNAIMA